MKSTRHYDPRLQRSLHERGSVVRTFGLCAYAIAILALILTGERVHADTLFPPDAAIPAKRINIARVAQEGDTLKKFRPLEGVVPAQFFEEPGSIRCRELPPKICRDLTKTEFELTSLRFMVPEVPGLSAKSLTIRRHSVIANYTFR